MPGAGGVIDENPRPARQDQLARPGDAARAAATGHDGQAFGRLEYRLPDSPRRAGIVGGDEGANVGKVVDRAPRPLNADTLHLAREPRADLGLRRSFPEPHDNSQRLT